jgi:hypothetical protein
VVDKQNEGGFGSGVYEKVLLLEWHRRRRSTKEGYVMSVMGCTRRGGIRTVFYFSSRSRPCMAQAQEELRALAKDQASVRTMARLKRRKRGTDLDWSCGDEGHH